MVLKPNESVRLDKNLSVCDEEAEQAHGMRHAGRVSEGKTGEEVKQNSPDGHSTSPLRLQTARGLVLGAVRIPEGEE